MQLIFMKKSITLEVFYNLFLQKLNHKGKNFAENGRLAESGIKYLAVTNQNKSETCLLVVPSGAVNSYSTDVLK